MLVYHITTKFQHQERLLEEAKRSIEVYKMAFSLVEHERRDLVKRFEQEKQALNEEIRQLRERCMHGLEERLGREVQLEALNGGILELKVRIFPLCSMPSYRSVQASRHKRFSHDVMLMTITFRLPFRQ